MLVDVMIEDVSRWVYNDQASLLPRVTLESMLPVTGAGSAYTTCQGGQPKCRTNAPSKAQCLVGHPLGIRVHWERDVLILDKGLDESRLAVANRNELCTLALNL